ncbi:hypothetical protein CPB85DRAFT_507377 [Mucidula mucida]|nr:hypothetical protein CPB85DRAFT_507377 [Mucidula mucida]
MLSIPRFKGFVDRPKIGYKVICATRNDLLPSQRCRSTFVMVHCGLPRFLSLVQTVNATTGDTIMGQADEYHLYLVNTTMWRDAILKLLCPSSCTRRLYHGFLRSNYELSPLGVSNCSASTQLTLRSEAFARDTCFADCTTWNYLRSPERYGTLAFQDLQCCSLRSEAALPKQWTIVTSGALLSEIFRSTLNVIHPDPRKINRASMIEVMSKKSQMNVE